MAQEIQTIQTPEDEGLADYPVLCQLWVESEQGWGVRPDGYSLHLTGVKLTKFIKTYWDGMPDYPVPETYSRPGGIPYVVGIGRMLLSELEQVDGIRYYTQDESPAPLSR